MTTAIHFSNEDGSNAVRKTIAENEPAALRTFTPTQAVLARSAGVFHWTPEGRRLYDYSSGVLVANLGHNPRRWLSRFARYLGWKSQEFESSDDTNEFVQALPMTAYNGVTEIEALAVVRLLANLQSSARGQRLDNVMWAASGSEAIQKALWACLHRDQSRDLIIATRYGFHGKKGLAGAATGCESDPDRDSRVKFISFPMDEVDDIEKYDHAIDLAPYRAELESLWSQHGSRLNCLITEPYLGGGGSYHPPASYLQLLEAFCRQHDILFILDEVQSNFGRTGCMYAFEKYGIEPDFVCLGKGMGNGFPVNAAVGRADIMASLKYGEASDTWSANPLSCAALLATLDEFEAGDVLENTRRLSTIFVSGLKRLKETSVIEKVRGEGMVFAVACPAFGDLPADEVANTIVEACYLGESGGDGIHLLGPLAGNALRVSPPMTMTEAEARDSLELLYRICQQVAERLTQVATRV